MLDPQRLFSCHTPAVIYFYFTKAGLSPMNSIQGKVDLLGAMENAWCSKPSPQPSNYDSLPETSKWVCRLERASGGGEMCLKVSTAGIVYFFPTFYTSVFMLLDLQQLSSLAEAIRLPPGSPEKPCYMKNIDFLAQLRLQILKEQVPEDLEDSSPFLKRWILRLIHRMPNSILKEGDLERAAEIYSKHDYNWKKGID